MLSFAVPDLHGRLDLLEGALTAIARHPGADRGATVIFLGDYIDRGPNSAQVLARLGAGSPRGWRWICLKGNHEAMMAVASRSADHLDWWRGNGGDATIASYGGDDQLMRHHLAWIDGLRSVHADRYRVFVHAGLDNSLPLDEQTDDVLLWKRYRREDTDGFGERHIVHGHDPAIDGPLRLHGRTGLDCYAWATGRLVIGVFDDTRPGGPCDLIEVRRPPAP